MAMEAKDIETTTAPKRVALLYKRDALPDEEIVRQLETRLTAAGHSVFIDRHLEAGVEWAREIESEIRQADAVVPLLSESSIQSEIMGFEVEHAHEAAQVNGGRPALLPVRVRYTGPLPEPLAGILDPLQYLLWDGEQDDEGLAAELAYALEKLAPVQASTALPAKGLRLTPRLTKPKPLEIQTPAEVKPRPPAALEAIGGAVPLDSEFYLPRPADQELQTAIGRFDSIVLIKGARQMGKTSMLARGLAYGRERVARTAFVDFQKLNARSLESVNALYLSLAESLADQLDLDVLPSDVWDERRSANVNFERFLRRHVLANTSRPLVWAMDEVDRLFAYPYASEVFGLFRSWHNERALDPSGPWSALTLVITYATEAHLFITDMNQSPFNVGTRLTLEDFSPLQVAELNRRYRSPLKTHEELNRFVRLLGGHPYLVRRALHEMAVHNLTLDDLEIQAESDEGIFGDHLRRILVLLARDEELTEIVRMILKGEPCPTPESFYRLRSAGVMHGTSQSDVRPRCRLYANYLKRHLL
jgi:hypothetical protein